jgi:hypothetical protein
MNDTKRKELLEKWGDVFDLKAEVHKQVSKKDIATSFRADCYMVNGLPVSKKAYDEYLQSIKKAT